MVMLPRLQAEEQLSAIYAGRVAQGSADEKGRAAIATYEGTLERQREGLPAVSRKPDAPVRRRAAAEALGLEVQTSGRVYNPLRRADG